MSDGRPTDAELGAIRERRRRVARSSFVGGSQMAADISALLAALDSALADLAAAEGALHDLTSPQSGEANAAYLRGVEDERGRVLKWLRVRARLLREQAGRHKGSELAYVNNEIVAILDTAARALESPPAPAAAPGGSQ